MKRMHVHVAVSNLHGSIAFYSKLFNAEPTVVKVDYAKWMLDDPRLNFAISARGIEPGVDHLGIQVDSADELGELHDRLAAAGEAMVSQEGATCCYARSDKHWVTDAQGVAWETFHTLESAPTYGADRKPAPEASTACCAPAMQKVEILTKRRSSEISSKPAKDCCG